MRTILITGASGLLGSNLALALRDRYDVFGIYRRHELTIEDCQMMQCDLLDENRLADVAAVADPDLIIHCAALANVDECERNEEEARLQTVGSSAAVARLAVAVGAKLIAISTDSVYSGADGPHLESGATVAPLNAYGRLKLEAEEEIFAIDPSALILRANFFGWAPDERSSLGEWFLNSLRSGDSISGFSDALFSSIYTGEMVAPLLEAVKAGLSGVYNFGGRNGVSKYQFGQLVADCFDLDPGGIREAKLEDIEFDAPRGRDLRLDVSKFERDSGYRLPAVEQSVYSFYKDSFRLSEVKAGDFQETEKVIPYGRHQVLRSDQLEVSSVLRSHLITQGPKVDEFEEAFAEMCGAKHAVACCNGTAALHLAMMAARIGPGDRVVTTPNTFLASANAAAYVGATPDFSDIDPVSYCLCPEALEANWQDDTRAVVAVDYAGQPANMPAIAEVAHSRGAIVIEDACHATGGRFHFQGEDFKVGGHPWADMTTFSFHPVKTLTSGEGGMVVTNNDTYAERLRSLRTHGMVRDPEQFVLFNTEGYAINEPPAWHLYEMQELGYNFRLSDIHAGLGLSQMAKLPTSIRNRQIMVERYNEAFKDNDLVGEPKLAKWLGDPEQHSLSWHLYAVRLKLDAMSCSRADILQACRAKGLALQIHYLPVHLQPYYAENYGYREGKCLEAENFSRECLSLPLYNDPSITPKVISTMQEIFTGSSR